jgi:hypothetical protein
LALDGAGKLVFGGLTAINSGFHFHKKADSYLIDLKVGCAKVRRRPTIFGRGQQAYHLEHHSFAVLWFFGSSSITVQGHELGRRY